jgi:hypothetical protein
LPVNSKTRDCLGGTGRGRGRLGTRARGGTGSWVRDGTATTRGVVAGRGKKPQDYDK